jgi:hypothetical protein
MEWARRDLVDELTGYEIEQTGFLTGFLPLEN